jgi:enamine deaminase RidA (YjgF/YER057c/UK114 family)
MRTTIQARYIPKKIDILNLPCLESMFVTSEQYQDLLASNDQTILAAIIHGDESYLKPDWPVFYSQLESLSEKCIEVYKTNEPPIYEYIGNTHTSRTSSLFFGITQGLSDSLTERSDTLYMDVLDLISQKGMGKIYRVWNEIPHINKVGKREERYKEFCFGRSKALQRKEYSNDFLPAASAIGSQGTNLGVYFIAGKSPSLQIENPLQISAYQYPKVYGERPPSFSRSQLLQTKEGEILFISGTASIKGYKSKHIGNIKKQTKLSLDNINTLCSSVKSDLNFSIYNNPESIFIKVYIRNHSDYITVKTILEKESECLNLIFVVADICREELLVEIEALIIGH